MIDFKNVTKDYGKNIALDDFSISIAETGIYCLLGRNGAGKTTLMKALAGHIPVTDGEVSVAERAVTSLAMPQNVHFVESGAAQFNIRLIELFRYAAEINPDFDMAFAKEMARRFRLDNSKKYRRLSFGMKTMVNTLIALASGKQILLLDEPVLGFDPIMRKTFYELLSESCAEKPKIVIVSTHIIDEIEKTAEKLIIIDRGRLILFGDMNEIDEKAYSVTGPTEQVMAATEGLRAIGETRAGGFLSRFIFDERIQASENVNIANLGLTEFFVGLVGDEGEVV
ncbi:MAG: ABC transporter ATP-binding protein [Clostridiales bacterium]|jgi:ABC-2 type transport system ATP-binding protein|nr:ABC transporter ATP-binding protein [Clostridiales bacterium]